MHVYTLGADHLESSSAKGLGILVPWWTAAHEAATHPCGKKRPIAFWAAFGRVSLACQGRWSLPSSRLWWGVSEVLCSQQKKYMYLLEQVLYKATKMMNRLEHLSYEERLSELGLLSFMKRKVKGILSMCISTRWEAMKKRKPDSSQWCPLARQKAMSNNENAFVKTHVVPSKHENVFLLWGCSNTGTDTESLALYSVLLELLISLWSGWKGRIFLLYSLYIYIYYIIKMHQ